MGVKMDKFYIMDKETKEHFLVLGSCIIDDIAQFLITDTTGDMKFIDHNRLYREFIRVLK